MIVLMTGGTALARLMRPAAAVSEHLAPAQMTDRGDQGEDAKSQTQSKCDRHSPLFGRQHVHRHLPREEDALFR